MKRRDLERHLRAHGARLLREGGNHSFWGFDAERSTAVPRHREVDFRLAAQDLRRSRHPASERAALRRAARRPAIAAIEEMIREGLAEPGGFNIREIDDRRETVRVFGVPGSAAQASTEVT